MRYTEAREILAEAFEQLDEEIKLLMKQLSPNDLGPGLPPMDEILPTRFRRKPGLDGYMRPPLDFGIPAPPLQTPDERLRHKEDIEYRRKHNNRLHAERLRDFRKKIQDGLNQKPYQRYRAPSGPGAGWDNPYFRPYTPPPPDRPDFD